MNRKFLLGLLCLLMGTASVFATAFDDANTRSKAGDFTGAAEAYEKILAEEGPDSAVFFNLGNCYQGLRRYGPAILAYERARLITPRDPDLLANLALARKAAAAFEEGGPNPKLEAVIGGLSRNEWSWLVAGAALFLGVVSVLGGAFHLPRQAGKVLWISAGAAGLAIIAGSSALYLRRTEGNRGIVLSENAAVRLSPFEKAESVGTPGPGRFVRLGVKNGGFHYVEVPGANLRGWLSEKDVAAILTE
ncbi:MAG: tetratricopeptide repeat protein [Verrucomicrobiota bacterium]